LGARWRDIDPRSARAHSRRMGKTYRYDRPQMVIWPRLPIDPHTGRVLLPPARVVRRMKRRATKPVRR